MDDVPIPGREEDQAFKQVLAHYDAPAYIRRARQVQEAYDLLVAHCRKQRDGLLKMVRIHLGLLHARAGDWGRLRDLVADHAQLDILRQLHDELQPRLRDQVVTTTSPRALRRALHELTESMERFNQRWQAFLQSADLTHVNQLRDGYNRWYLLEKECALRSSKVARLGFCKLEPLRAEELFELFPLLRVPR